MKLKEIRVQLYRNFVDSGSVLIDDSVTCLVGQNESGKTAFLEALYSLKPVYPNLVRVDITLDYPRWRKVHDEREMNLGDIFPIEAIFSLNDEERDSLGKILALPLPLDAKLSAKRSYGGEHRFSVLFSEKEMIKEIVTSVYPEGTTRDQAFECKSLDELLSFTEGRLRDEDKRTKPGKDLADVIDIIGKAKDLISGEISPEHIEYLLGLIPTFFYFSEYSPLRGRIDLTTLLDKPKESLEDHEQTALALLNLVGVEGPEFMESEFELRIAELEAAANEVSSQIFEYWTQNKDLLVDLHADSETIQTPQGQTDVLRYLDIRLNDLRHHMTTNFQTRSRGFQWFFSFIVAFSKYEGNPNVIILLDEPGLGLHARAQGDFLRFIEEKLSSETQVIYTSHSPFVVNPKHLERVRLVEDLSSREKPDTGAKISTDVLSVRKDTLFPLQAALGYDLAQNLFIGGSNLVVEGPSDLVFLTVISEYLDTKDITHLDPRFTIIPVGGADKIPTFVALLGAHLDVSVLVDARSSPNQRLQDLIDKGLLSSQRLVSVGQVTQVSGSNIEDLFTPGEYIRLYKEAFGADLKVSDLTGSDSILMRIKRHIGADFNHLKPAIKLLTNRDVHLNRLSDGTIERFRMLFDLLNDTL